MIGFKGWVKAKSNPRIPNFKLQLARGCLIRTQIPPYSCRSWLGFCVVYVFHYLSSLIPSKGCARDVLLYVHISTREELGMRRHQCFLRIELSA